MTDTTKMTFSEIDAKITEMGYTLEIWPPPRPMDKWAYCIYYGIANGGRLAAYDGSAPCKWGARRHKTELSAAQAALRWVIKDEAESVAIRAAYSSRRNS